MQSKMELLLKFEFIASHSLAGFEIPHPHLWKLEFGVLGEPIEGRIIDIVSFRAKFQEFIHRLEGTYLNDEPAVSFEVRRFPTCETLSLFFGEEVEKILFRDFRPNHPSVRMSFVQVAICDMDRTETGAVRVTF